MKPLKDIEETIRTKLHTRADGALHNRVLERVREARAQYEETTPAPCEPVLRRSIMKNPLARLAVAAAIIAAILLGLALFIDTGATSGVVWAEVAQKVEASPGVIFRSRGTGTRDPNDDWPNGYTVFWRSAAVSRMDKYRDGRIYRTVYTDCDAKTFIGVLHDAKKYTKETMSDERVQRSRANRGWSDPQDLLNMALSLEHHELGQETIDGLLCEGIEVTGPDGSTGRIWVAVETGYPVLVQIEGIGGGDTRPTGTMDQFQWDVDLSAEGVEPDIPTDYEPL